MKHILIMEDDIALALDWKNAFELNGYDVTLSSDGGEAEALLKKNEYDLVITDLFVKEGIGGLHVSLKLYQMGRKAPPAIAVTGVATSRDNQGPDQNIFLEQARKLGSVGEIQKPFPAGELVVMAQSVFEAKSKDTKTG